MHRNTKVIIVIVRMKFSLLAQMSFKACNNSKIEKSQKNVQLGLI